VGSPRPASGAEVGWKDTIIAYPGTVTRIIVPFGGTAAGIPAPFVGDAKGAKVQRFVGQYVFHCHILEHEDNDMMSPLNVH
jgi:FtsP/CotA-like multicopper oxidase with cupredoxin domain